MNRFNNKVISIFLSPKNTEQLHKYLLQRCSEHNIDNHHAVAFLRDNLHNMMQDQAQDYSNIMSNSDPMVGITPEKQTIFLNKKFAAHVMQTMRDVIGENEEPAIYSVDDGQKTANYSTRGKTHNEVLKSWDMNPGTILSFRDDKQGSQYDVMRRDKERWRVGDDGTINQTMGGGITFCDQSRIGLNNHERTFFEDPMFNALNRPDKQVLYGGYFGTTGYVPTGNCSQRVFRANEAGVENGIPRYEQRLYKRNYDRNIDETLADTQYNNWSDESEYNDNDRQYSRNQDRGFDMRWLQQGSVRAIRGRDAYSQK